MNSLAQLLFPSNGLNEAESLYRQIADTDPGSDPSTLMATCNNLANICRQTSRA
jgi:hypothetical protein